MIENKDIELLDINLESNLKCEILDLFDSLKQEFQEKESEEIFQISNKKSKKNDIKKRNWKNKRRIK